MFDFEDACTCGGTYKWSTADVANGRTVTCSRGCRIKLEDGGGAREAAKAEADLDKALGKLSRTIKF